VKKKWDVIHSCLLDNAIPYAGLHNVINLNGILKVEKSSERSLFKFMCRIVSGQQLSTKAAQTIWSRLENLCKINNKKLSELCEDNNFETIRSSGLSKNKTKAMIMLNQSFKKKEITTLKLQKLEEQEFKQFISGLWGFGPWSAEMILLGYFGSLDIWSSNDSALKKGIDIALGEHSKSQNEIITRFSPYRTLLSRHIWKGLDDGLLK
jgi:DNA-3-methyladenine glycosylase II|tara:strand:+ start:460 stop:1083 length:624 start_codon:yes stop_codon:yes gene_type:complete